ncbi:MAG: phosphoribosylformylglycinamidine cyclo-ligase, partial [Ignavibacteria bacterium]|nr:phosphoribosylformylglycinamidine cyclo-ligase [Ignavibacteria bacterium]
KIASDFVKGVADGCVDSACALLGGGTAEMPGFYDEGKYDIAGFGVGIVEKEDIVNGEAITAGDVLIGLASTGVHSNGFSLVRKLVTDYSEPFAGKTIGEVLLTPTKIYVRPVLAVLELYRKAVHGMVHITGGGFYENIPRMYPSDDEGYMSLISVIKKNSWKVPGIFDELVRRGANPDRMYNTFNMGIGFVMAVEASKAADIIAELKKHNQEACVIGRVEKAVKKVSEQIDAVLFED